MTITVNQKLVSLATAQTVARLKDNINITVTIDTPQYIAIAPAVQLINAANQSGKAVTVTLSIPTADITEIFHAQQTKLDYFHLWSAIWQNLNQENIKAYQQDRQQLVELAENYAKPLTEQEKDILRTYCAPYGLDMPKLEPTESTVTDYIPRIGDTFGGYADSNVQTVTREIQQRAMQTIGHRQRLTEIKQARRLLESIRFYLENDIPFIDGWTVCPKCGLPKRADRIIWHNVGDEIVPDTEPTPCKYCG